MCTASRLRHPCVHSFRTAIALCAQLQDYGTPACTAKAAASLHASLKTAERLLEQLTKCSCTSVCCCNPSKTAIKTAAPLRAQFQDNCYLMCIVSRHLQPYAHSIKTAAPLCAQLLDSCNSACTALRQLQPAHDER